MPAVGGADVTVLGQARDLELAGSWPVGPWLTSTRAAPDRLAGIGSPGLCLGFLVGNTTFLSTGLARP